MDDFRGPLVGAPEAGFRGPMRSDDDLSAGSLLDSPASGSGFRGAIRSGDNDRVPLMDSPGGLQAAAGANSLSPRWGVRPFSRAWEERLRPVDDAIIGAVQSLQDIPAAAPVARAVALAFTVSTAVEVGLAAPFVLYIIGQDDLALLTTSLMLMLVVTSQLFKRFLWRDRPWTVGRARGIRRNATSSFPSRAVACGVVYAFVAAAVAVYPDDPAWSAGPFLALTAGVALLTSFGRVELGVHYPSDCLAGALLGLLCCVAGAALYDAEDALCASCRDDSCYSSAADTPLSLGALTAGAAGALATATAAAVGAVVALMAEPVVIWEKAAHVAGLLLPCIAFHVTFLCPRVTGASLAKRGSTSAGVYALAVFVALACTLLGLFVSKRKQLSLLKRIGAFLLLYVVVFVSLALCRS